MKIQDLKNEIIDKFYHDDYDDLDDVSFADDHNRLFPIDNRSHVEASLELINEKELFGSYSPSERLLIVDRVIAEAHKYEIDLGQFKIDFDNDKGGQNMTREEMINTPEFKSAVEEAVKAQLNENNTQKELETAKARVQELTGTIETLKGDLATKAGELESVTSEFSQYKDGIEKDKVVEARLKTLTEAGFAFKDSTDKVKAMLRTMDDTGFKDYQEMLGAVKDSAKADVKPPEPPAKPDLVKASQDNAIPQAQAKEDAPADKTAVVSKLFGI